MVLESDRSSSDARPARSGCRGAAPFREAVIDLDAIARNVRTIADRVAPAEVMAVVKADAYGHGAVEAARAALAGGATRLGVADLDEALALRAAGIDAPILAWLHDPDADFARGGRRRRRARRLEPRAARARGIRVHGRPAPRVHLKIDTGLSRNGVAPRRTGRAVVARGGRARARRAGSRVRRRLQPLRQHLARRWTPRSSRPSSGRSPRPPTAGLDPRAAPPRRRPSRRSATRRPRYDLVRIGIGVYGLTPVRRRHDLHRPRPAPGDELRARGRRRAPRRRRARASRTAHIWHAERADDPRARAARLRRRHPAPRLRRRRRGAARRARRTRSSAASRWTSSSSTSATTRSRSATRSCVFGDPATGAPTADDWAEAAGTIGYEIVTRIGPRGCTRDASVRRRLMRARRSPTPTRWRRSARASRARLRAGDLVLLDGRARRGQDHADPRPRRRPRRPGAGARARPSCSRARTRPRRRAAARARRRLPARQRRPSSTTSTSTSTARSSWSSGAPGSLDDVARLLARGRHRAPEGAPVDDRRMPRTPSSSAPTSRACSRCAATARAGRAAPFAARPVGWIPCSSRSTPRPARASPSSTATAASSPRRAPTTPCGTPRSIGGFIRDALAAAGRRPRDLSRRRRRHGPRPVHRPARRHRGRARVRARHRPARSCRSSATTPSRWAGTARAAPAAAGRDRRAPPRGRRSPTTTASTTTACPSGSAAPRSQPATTTCPSKHAAPDSTPDSCPPAPSACSPSSRSPPAGCRSPTTRRSTCARPT